MSHALMTSTHITYQVMVTVNVNVNADKALLLLVAYVAFVIWMVRRFFLEVSLLTHDFTEAVAFTATISVIGLKALACGCLGVRL